MASEDESGQLTLAEPLAIEGALLLPIKDRSRTVVDLVTAYGSLSGSPPALAMLSDVEMQLELYSADGVLFIAFSLRDVGWLRSAGLAATLCPHVAELTVPLLLRINRQVRRTLFEFTRRRFSWEQEEEVGASHVPPNPVLVLVGFSPGLGGLEVPAGLSVEVSKLAKAEYVLEIEFPETCLWSPGAGDLETFVLLQECGADSKLRRAILASVADAARALSSFLPEEPPPPYFEARARYRLARRRIHE